MIRVDFGPWAVAARKQLAEQKELITRAAQTTVNKLAKAGVEDIQARFRASFDKPTRFTINSLVWVDNSGPLEARIEWRHRGEEGKRDAKGTLAPSKWLRAEMLGGPRRQKASERRFQRTFGIGMPGGQLVYLVPTDGARRMGFLDAYGNVIGSKMSALLSALGALGGGGQGFDGNKKPGKKGRGKMASRDFFVRLPPGTAELGAGIYERISGGYGGKGSRIVPLFRFARSAPKYAVRIDVRQILQSRIDRSAFAYFTRALRKQLSPGAEAGSDT